MSIGNVTQRTLRGGDGRLFPAYLIGFDAEAFDPTLYSISAVACPPSVVRSVRKRQAEFYFGRLAARHALSALGVAPVDIPVGPLREPVWPEGIIGSITHAQGIAAAAVVRNTSHAGVGIDIEGIVTAESQAALLATVVSGDELAYLLTLACVLPLNTLLTIVFSAKESLFKGSFRAVGGFFDFSAAGVTHVDIEQKCLSLTLLETLSPAFVRTQVFKVYFDFIQDDIVITSFAW